MFSEKYTAQPLLSETQIMQLIHAAPVKVHAAGRQLSQRARAGEQSSSISGAGSDFAEVRHYQQGDDLRHIDWRATARAQKTLVRTYYSEFSQPLCLVIDRRAAMRYATRVRLKVTQALRMALWLGGREARLGREISVVILDKPCHWLPPQQGMLSLKLMARLANQPCPPISPDSHHESSWSTILSGIKQHLSPETELFIFSDFSGLTDADNRLLRLLGLEYPVGAIQIMDSTEDDKKTDASLPATVELHWAGYSQYLAVSPASTSSANKNALSDDLKIYQAAMSSRFRNAGIAHLQLGVEQHDLSAFSLKAGL